MNSSYARHLPPGYRFHVASLLAARSLPRLWKTHVQTDPNRPVFRFGDHPWVTAQQLEASSRGRAEQLAALGVAPGDRVLYAIASPRDLIEWHVAIMRLGAIAVPTNPALESELEPLVIDSEPRVVVTTDPELRAWAGSARRSGIVVLDAHKPPGDRHTAAAMDVAEPDDDALLAYTSGTTGRPKGVLLSHGNLLATVEAVRLAWQWTSDDRLVLTLPLFHMHGMGLGVHGVLAAGASAVVLDRFNPEAVQDVIARDRCTMFFGVPTMYRRLIDAGAAPALAALRLCAAGSAPLPAEMSREFEETTGQRIIERYGSTESLLLTSNPLRGERRPGSVGLPLPGVELRLAPTDGEIQARGPNVSKEYWRNPQATADAFAHGGWFRTGDLGSLDADGYLRIQGRSKELVITGGYNVYPREVEEVLEALAGVAEVAVIGTPSDEWGELVTAVVVPDPAADAPPTLEEIRAHCEGRLAKYKAPRALYLVKNLPRNALGKVQRQVIAAQISDSDVPP